VSYFEAPDRGYSSGVLKADALQNAILTSANFSIIATDEKGIIQLFNVGAEQMLGYRAAEVIDRTRPSEYLKTQQELVRPRRALALSQLRTGYPDRSRL
jgi:PAS domain S-box-containing protein